MIKESWRVTYDRGAPIIVKGVRLEDRIAMVLLARGSEDIDLALEHAHKIAAAPELLEACEWACKTIKKEQGCHENPDYLIPNCNSCLISTAIDKAKEGNHD